MLFDERFEFCDLKAVDHAVEHGLLRFGIESFALPDGDPPAECVGEFLSDLFRLGGDDHRRLGAVDAVDDEVKRARIEEIGDDGIERELPAVEPRPDRAIENDVERHDEVAHRQADALGKHDAAHFDAVERASETDRHAAADARKKSSERRAEQEIGPRDGRALCRVVRERQFEQERRERVDRDDVDGIHRKRDALFLHAEQKEGHVQDDQKYRHRHRIAHRAEEHGKTGQPAVVQVDGGEEQFDPHRIDDARSGQQQEIERRKLPLHNTPLFPILTHAAGKVKREICRKCVFCAKKDPTCAGSRR